jgi:hypothetical protein
MADLNDEVNAISEHLRRLNMEFNRYGELTAQSADAIRRKTSAETYRDAQLEKSGQAAAESLQSIAKAVGSAASAMYEGRQGASAFNESIANMNTAIRQAAVALTLLTPGGVAVKAVVGALAAVGLAAYETKEKLQELGREMIDKQFDSYKKLSAVGAASANGLAGVAESARKTGTNMLKMDEYLNLIGSNSKQLALFNGSVADGRVKFDDIGQALAGERQRFIALGLSQEDLNQGMMDFVRLQTITGNSQKMSVDQLAIGTKKYLYEQDELTKLTGLTRKEQTAIREQALSEQRFRAKLDAMRASGDEKQIAAAKQLEDANVILASQSPELAQGFRDLQSGAITTAAAQKAVISTNGEILTSTRDLQNGIASAGEASYKIFKAGGKFATDLNMSAQLGTFEGFAAKYSELKQGEIFAQGEYNEKIKKILEERDKQIGKEGGKPQDPNLAKYAELVKQQQDAMIILQQALNKGFTYTVTLAGGEIFKGDIGVGPAMEELEKKTAAAVVEAIKEYLGAFGNLPPTQAKPLKGSAREQAVSEVNVAQTEIKSSTSALTSAKAEANRLQTANASREEKEKALLKVAEAEKKLKNAEEARDKALAKLIALEESRPVPPKPEPSPSPSPPPPAEETDEERIAREKKAAEVKKSEIAKAKEALLAPAPELKVGGKTAFKDLVQEQKDALNHLLENMGGRPIMGQTPGDDRGKESWEKELKKSPREQQVLFDAINEQIRNERKKKLEELEKQELDNTSKATPVRPNRSGTMGEGEDFALKYAELKKAEIFTQENYNEKFKKALDERDQMAGTAGTDRASINLASMLPNVPNTDGATAGLTINSDVATLNSKGMNVTLDNSTDVAKLIMEPMITQMETSQKDQSMARSNFEASIGDLKAEFSKQKATDELLLAAVQELIRIQKNGVSVNEKILAAQA